jgi:hypothetical protein
MVNCLWLYFLRKFLRAERGGMIERHRDQHPELLAFGWLFRQLSAE